MFEITNLTDVQRFFRYLYETRKVAFHPDEDFESYICFANGESTFTAAECMLFNRLMEDSFKVCEAMNVSIYDTATNILKELDLAS